MADKPHEPGAPPEHPRRRRRATPTIDLTATEVGGPKPQPEPAAGARTGGFFHWLRDNVSVTTLTAGIAGGVFVAALMFLMWMTGLVPIRYAGTTATRARVAVLEMQVKELHDRAQTPADTKSLDDLTQRLTKLEESIAKLPASEPGLAERVGAIDSALQALGIALAALNKRNEDIAARGADTEALEKRIAALESTAKETRDNAERTSGSDAAARLALSAVMLREAVLSGSPYLIELNAAKAQGANVQALAPLDAFAGGGLPTNAALAHELSAAIPTMLDKAGAKPASGNFFDRLQANAGRLVRISPVDAPPGNDPAAVLARIEVAIAQSDIPSLLSELARLPENVRGPAEAWIKKANERQAAARAARQFADNAARALGSR
jgi:hypothetical protein